MTPAETYTQKRAEAESLIRQHAPTRLQDSLLELLRPAIALSATRFVDEAIPLGASTFGGAPDVPAEFVWPMWNEKPLGFLAQINLEEVAPFDVENQLPKSGLLSFFVINREETIWGDPDQKEGWRVFFWTQTSLNRIQPPADSREFEMHTQKVKVEGQWILPMEDEAEDISVDEDFLWEWEEHYIWQQMLGTARALQISPRFCVEQSARGISFNDSSVSREQEKDIWRGAKDWQLFIQLDTMYWFKNDCFDLGTLYFMIRREDLAAHDFSNVWLNVQIT